MIKIKVFGVGGAGCNAINYMIDNEIEGVEFVAANTDTQALLSSNAAEKITLGFSLFKGMGAGGEPELGEKAALASKKDIEEALKGVDLLFLISGMGGGTGTGAAPVIAKIAQEMKILTICAATKPFSFEGKIRIANAEKGIQELKKNVDSLLIVSNDKLLEHHGNASIMDSFNDSDETLRLAVQAISDLIVIPAKINLDFADVKKVFQKKKNAFFGFGVSEGPDKAIKATKQAIVSKLLEASPKGLKNAIVNFVSGTETSLFDINDSIELIKERAGENVNIFFGLRINKDLKDKLMVSIIGTDFDEDEIVYANKDLIEKIRKNRSIDESIKSSGINEELWKDENEASDSLFSPSDDDENKNTKNDVDNEITSFLKDDE